MVSIILTLKWVQTSDCKKRNFVILLQIYKFILVNFQNAILSTSKTGKNSFKISSQNGMNGKDVQNEC